MIDDPHSVRESLIPKEDRKWRNPFGEIWWMKELLNSSGEKIGITECCEVNIECDRHKQISIIINNSKFN